MCSQLLEALFRRVVVSGTAEVLPIITAASAACHSNTARSRPSERRPARGNLRRTAYPELIPLPLAPADDLSGALEQVKPDMNERAYKCSRSGDAGHGEEVSKIYADRHCEATWRGNEFGFVYRDARMMCVQPVTPSVRAWLILDNQGGHAIRRLPHSASMLAA